MHVAALDPACTAKHRLRRRLRSPEQQACAHGLAELVVLVNARFVKTVVPLFDAGYLVERLGPQVSAGTASHPPDPLCVNLSRRAG